MALDALMLRQVAEPEVIGMFHHASHGRVAPLMESLEVLKDLLKTQSARANYNFIHHSNDQSADRRELQYTNALGSALAIGGDIGLAATDHRMPGTRVEVACFDSTMKRPIPTPHARRTGTGRIGRSLELAER
jgi:hypothetical protein